MAPQAAWRKTSDLEREVLARRVQAQRAEVLRFMHDLEGKTYRQIEKETGIPRSTVQRLVVRYQRRRDRIEAEAPTGAVQWAGSQTCPACGTRGMQIRRGKHGWFAGCWAFVTHGCRGTVGWPSSGLT